MKLYQTTKGTWVGTIDAWKATQRAEGGDASGAPTPIEVPTNPKADFIDWLNGNLERAPEDAPTTVPQDPVPTIIHTEGPIDLDELFMKAPINQQLRLAVSAIDNGVEFMGKLVSQLRKS